MEDENRGKEPDKEDGFDLKVKDLTHCSSLSSVNQAGFRWQEIVIKRKPAFFYPRTRGPHDSSPWVTSGPRCGISLHAQAHSINV